MPHTRTSLRFDRRSFLGASAGFTAAGMLANTPARARAGLKIAEDRLANGLQVYVIEDHRLPLVTHTLWYRVGAGDEQPGKSGIAHFFEHLMFKGTERFPGQTFKTYVERHGGGQNAFTSMDYTYYIQRLPVRHLADLMAMEADRMTGLKLTPDDIKTELGAVLEEKRGNETHAGTHYNERIRAALYPSHRVGLPVIGLEPDLRALDRDTLFAFYRAYYAPNNAVLIVGGDTTLAEVMRLAADTYAKIPPSTTLPARTRPPLAPPLSADRVVYETTQTSSVSTARIFRLPSAGDIPLADRMPLVLFGALVSGYQFEHGFHRRLVETQRIATSASAGASFDLTAGQLSFSLSAVNGVTAPAAERALEEAIGIVVERLPDQADLDATVLGAIATDIRSDERTSSNVTGLGSVLTIGLDAAYYTSWRDRLRAVTLGDLRRVIDRYMRADQSVLSQMIPKG